MAQGAPTKVKKRKKSVLKRAKQSHVRAGICSNRHCPRLSGQSAKGCWKKTQAIATNRVFRWRSTVCAPRLKPDLAGQAFLPVRFQFLIRGI